jgi:transposase
MAVDRNAIVTLHEKGESNSVIAKKLQIRRETVWKVVKKFKETGETCNRPGQGRKRSVRTKQLVKNTREKLRRNPRRSAAKLAAEAGVSQTSMRRVLKDDLKTSPYKMQTRHELTDRHERMRLERCQHILDLIEDGTLPNLVFSDEKKFDIEQSVNRQNDRVWSRDGSVATRTATRRQNPMSVMVWAAVTATGRSPLVFVPSGVKLNSQRYISDILEAVLLPWARKHFNGSPWSFQQDSAPSHGSNMTQNWIQGHIPAFISKNEWPSRSPDLNPLDFSVWAILESRVCRTPHDSLDSLKSKLTREWDLIPQEMLRVSCEAFPRRLEAVIKNKGGHIE